MDQFIGEIRRVGFNFQMPGWAICDGRLLNISENEALFALIGTTYGGDGVQTFGIPDLRGRAAISTGQAPGLNNRALGERVAIPGGEDASDAAGLLTVTYQIALQGIFPSQN